MIHFGTVVYANCVQVLNKDGIERNPCIINSLYKSVINNGLNIPASDFLVIFGCDSYSKEWEQKYFDTPHAL